MERSFLAFLVSVMLSTSVAQAAVPPVFKPAAPKLAPTNVHFFANSVRGDIDVASEGRFVLAMYTDIDRLYELNEMPKNGPTYETQKKFYDNTPSCTGFLIENTKGQFLAGTARHCVSFREENACAGKTFRFKSLATGDVGTCRRVVAHDEHSDFVIFEIDFGLVAHRVRTQTTALKLQLDFEDFAGQRDLEMYGFPADPERHSQPTKTSSCWMNSPYNDPQEKNYFASNESTESQTASAKVTGGYSAEFEKALNTVWGSALKFKHNCSTYGGNSGGPVVMAGTLTLVGLPLTYSPGTQVFPAEDYGYLESPLTLAVKTWPTFQREGIVYDSKVLGR